MLPNIILSCYEAKMLILMHGIIFTLMYYSLVVTKYYNQEIEFDQGLCNKNRLGIKKLV